MAENNGYSESWEQRMKESDRRFYRTMNELRVEMGLLPVTYSNSMEDQGTQGNNSIEVFEDLEISGDSTESEEMMVYDDLLLDSMANGVAKEVVVLIGAVKDDQRFSRYDELIVLEMGNGPNIGKEPSSLVARIVFDELPDSKICHEPELLVEISKEIGTTSQDELNVKVPAMMMNQEQDNLKTIPYIAEALALVVAYGKLGEFVDESLDCLEIRGRENRVFDPGDFRYPRFAKKTGLEHLTFSMMEEVVVEQKCSYPSRVRADRMIMPYDRGKEHLLMIIFLSSGVQRLVELLDVLGEFLRSTDATSSFVFDPGGVSCAGSLCVESLIAVILTDSCWDMDGLILVFDPGGNFLIFGFEKKAKSAC